MPTIIDSLIVTLGLDDKKFKQGTANVNKSLRDTGREADKTGKQLKTAGEDGARGFGTATSGLAKFLTALAGAQVIKTFVVNIVQTNAELYRFSRNLKQNASDVSAWGNAIEITGGDAKAFQGTLSMLSKSQTELQMTGQSSLIPYFSRFNVAMMDANGNARKGTDILMDFADRMQGMDRTKAYNTLQAMGIDEGTANAMLEGRQSLEALIAKQKQHGALTDQQALNAEKTRRSMTEAKMTANAFKNEMADNLNPTLKSALDLFNQLDTATSGWSTTILGTVATIGVLSTSLGGLARILTVLTGGTAAAGGAAGGAAAAGSVGLMARFGKWIKGGLGIGLLLHSEEANAGEQELLDKKKEREAMRPGETEAQRYERLTGKKWEAEAPAAPQATAAPAPAAGGNDLAAKLAEAEKKTGLPAGVLQSVIKQETGGNKAYLDDPSKYHYGLDANGRRVAPHTGKISTAFGPFGLLESTANKPGYGVAPLKDKGIDEQIRFASEYLAARSKSAGGVAAGLAGYGEGGAYSASVMKRAELAGVPGASSLASTAAGAASQAVSNVTNSIGEIKVYTQATNAEGVAKDIRSALDSQLTSQANRGMS